MPSRFPSRLTLALVALTVATACVTTPLGRRQFTLYPEAELEAQAAAVYDQMRSEQPISRDQATIDYVLCVSNALTAALPPGSPRRWEVTLFEDDTANAFALPGGKIGVHTGLLRVAKTQDQLATVIGHEIAHVLELHANARASQKVLAGIAIEGATAAIAGDQPSEEQEALAQVFGLGAHYGAVLPFGRSHETDADLLGLDIMADAGFDPRQSVVLWRNMAAASQGQPLEWMSTHPSHGSRIQRLEERIPDALPRYQLAQEAGRRPHCK